MAKNKTRKVKERKAPEESATSLPEGTMKAGWVIKKSSNGVPRWMPKKSVELNGFRLFTTDFAAKNIGKSLILYLREYQDMWPKKNAWTTSKDSSYYKYKFIPNGDGIKGKTKIENWLKTQKPEIKKGDHFYIDGPVYECIKNNCNNHFSDSLQVDSTGGQFVSSNLMNTEIFVKI